MLRLKTKAPLRAAGFKPDCLQGVERVMRRGSDILVLECFGTATFWSVLECTIVKSKECRSRCRSHSFCCDILVSKSPQCFTPGKCYKVKSTNDPILTRLLGLSPRSSQRLSPQRLKRFQHYLQGTTGAEEMEQDAKSNKAPSKLNNNFSSSIGVQALAVLPS